MDVKLYDTVKDFAGGRYRVVEMDSKNVKLKGITTDGKSKPGKAKVVSKETLEDEFTRVDLPPVTVTKPAPKVVPDLEPENIDEMILEASAKAKNLEEENKNLRKTISKMKQMHETEIAERDEAVALFRGQADELAKANLQQQGEISELNDRISELEIYEKKYRQYSDALDDDSVAMSKIRNIAGAMMSLMAAAQDLCFEIKDETEGRA